MTTDTNEFRPPYGAAALTAGLILFGYFLTIAPTVTFWDAGEFIAAMKTLGIPHPPGTPLFVLIGHVWGKLFAVSNFAFRTNMLSALLGALGGGFLFLVAHETLRPLAAGLDAATSRLLRIGGAAAAAIIGSYTFTNWQNNLETEVYAVSVFTIAAVSWLSHVWRARRGDEHAPRVLLLILYLGGISIGNHLLALLAGPAVVAFLAATLWHSPAADPVRRRTEWAQVAVVAGTWALLIGLGLGSTTLITLGSVCFLVAAGFAFSAGAGLFALLALVIAAVGVTPYLYLYIRSAQNPFLNEAAPSTWDNLLAVIRREQYPIRTPLDDPTQLHGPDNPGRSLQIIWLQILNYFQYFTWQWANTLGDALRAAVAIAFLALGLQGSILQRRSDRPAWWLVFMLFMITGPGLVAYMNFKPGFSLPQAWEAFPDAGDHEVRDRDYFFVVSFITWGFWAGLGLAALARRAIAARGASLRPLAAAILVLGVAVPVAGNWSTATRRGPTEELPANVAYNLLNTVPPYGILFTYGDNDTFPLWWAQEVEGIRRDVTIVCLALANTDWYIKQLRDNPIGDFDEAAAPAIWRGRNPTKPTWPLHTLTDEQVDQMMVAQQLPRDMGVQVGPLTARLRAGEVLYPNDMVSLMVLRQNVGRRPIVWSVTTGRSYQPVIEHIVQQGLGYRLETERADSAALGLFRMMGSPAPLDVALTERLATETYRYGELAEADKERLESTASSFASTLALPFTQLAYAYEARGDLQKMESMLARAASLSPNPALRTALEQVRMERLQTPGSAPGSPAQAPPAAESTAPAAR
jgi:hypothetical protein